MAEKMRYENEIENAKVDDEFNNSEEDLSAEDIYRVYMEEIAAIPAMQRGGEREASRRDPERKQGGERAPHRRQLKECPVLCPGLHQQRCPDGGPDPGSQSGAHDAGR